MGRPARHHRETLLESARDLSAQHGPQNLTIARVARRANAPVGSIYHRYKSRAELLGAVWLDLVETFQAQFLACLEGPDPAEAGLASLRFSLGWIAEFPREARLLLLHRREDFAADAWPATYRRRAQRLTAAADRAMANYAERLLGRTDADAMRQVRWLLVDLPRSALRRELEEGGASPAGARELLMATCSFALRRARRQAA